MPEPFTRAAFEALLRPDADYDAPPFYPFVQGGALLLCPRCHPNAALVVSYEAGVLSLTCRQCHEGVVHVVVGE